MPIPIVHRKSAENVIATYDYIDIAEGTGTVQYYGIRGKTLSGSSLFYSIIKGLTYFDGTENGCITDDDGATAMNMTSFNFPKIIKGNLYLTGTFVATSAGTVGFTIQKVSKGIVTNLANKDWIPTTAAVTRFLLKFEIPKTLFKVGDILRILVEVVGCAANEGLHINSESVLGYEPFKIYVPYKIDL